MTRPVEGALAAWRAALGDASVCDEPQALEAAATATFPTSQKIVALLRPASIEQVGECLRIAGRFGVPVYPVSGGHNWGLGSRVPATDGCAVLDLGRMDAIIAFDDVMGTLTVEPGVSFRQVQAYLRDAGGQWFLPAIGGPADASVIGNLAERGDGAGPTGDRASNACALQVVLPDGSPITTGFGMFEGAAMTALARSGPGPGLDGLFLQSGMGVIVGATLFLSPVPAHLALLRVKIVQTAALITAVDALRALVRDGVLQPGCLSIWNGTKIHMRGRSYPWEALAGRTPLPAGPDNDAQAWLVMATLHSASPAIGAARATYAAQLLSEAGLGIDVLDETSHPGLREACGGALGGVDDVTAASVYWRKKHPAPATLLPEADHCGVHWICLALPLDGAAVAETARLVEQATFRHSFEAVMSGYVASPRALHLFVAILYDRDVAQQDEAARACHDEIVARLAARGVHPMRLGIQSMDHLSRVSAPYAALMRRVKHALDPQGLLAPGRYEM